MSANDKTSDLVSSSRRRARQLRIIGVIVLLLGIAGAGVVYWMGTRSQDLSDNPSMVGFDRAETRQMEQLYGKSGDLIEQWSNDLKQPGTQAVIIVAVSVIIASGCFYFARLFENGNESN
jgi:flagellar basal body-associated protein FliL